MGNSSVLKALDVSFLQKKEATDPLHPTTTLSKTVTPESALAPKVVSKKPYHLGALIDLALTSNPLTRAAWSQAKASSAAVGEARSLYYPWVKSGFTGGHDSNYLPQVNGPNVYSRNQATVFFSMEYILLDFGRRDADVNRTIALFHALGLTYQRKLQEVIFTVQKAYFAHEASLWRKKAAETNLFFTKTLEEMIAKENGAGLSAMPELLQSRKRVLEAQYEVESATAAVRNTLGDLCVAAGLQANTPLEIATTEQPISVKKMCADADELIAQALELRPDLAARAAELKASKEATKRAMADFFPVIKLEGQYINSTYGYTATQGSESGTFKGTPGIGYSGFVAASWDIFDGFERVFRMKRRQEEDKVAAQNLEQAKLTASQDVWTTYNNALAAGERVNYADGFVASAKETFEATKAAVENGLVNVTDCIEVASALAAAQSELALAVADYSTTLAGLAFAIGSSRPATESVPTSFPAPGQITHHLLSSEAAAFGKKIH